MLANGEDRIAVIGARAVGLGVIRMWGGCIRIQPRMLLRGSASRGSFRIMHILGIAGTLQTKSVVRCSDEGVRASEAPSCEGLGDAGGVEGTLPFLDERCTRREADGRGFLVVWAGSQSALMEVFCGGIMRGTIVARADAEEAVLPPTRDAYRDIVLACYGDVAAGSILRAVGRTHPIRCRNAPAPAFRPCDSRW